MHEEEGGYVLTSELREVLGVTPDELEGLVHQIRSILPPRLAVSETRVTQQEAEFIIARAARDYDDEPVVLDFDPAPLLPVFREREEQLIRYEKRAYNPGHIEEFGVTIGENPHSWTILWFILGIIILSIAVLLIFFRA